MMKEALRECFVHGLHSIDGETSSKGRGDDAKVPKALAPRLTSL